MTMTTVIMTVTMTVRSHRNERGPIDETRSLVVGTCLLYSCVKVTLLYLNCHLLDSILLCYLSNQVSDIMFFHVIVDLN